MANDHDLNILLQHRLKIRHLVLLTTIAEQASISKAASVLNITQSATTKALRELEDALEVRLFARTPAGVILTAYGQSLIVRARTILAQVHSAADELNNLKIGAAGRVVIGILRAAAPALVPRALVQLRKTHPNIAVSVIEGTYDILGPALRAGELDLLVGYLPAFRPRHGLTQERLYVDRAVIVVRRNHPLRAVRKPISLADLADRQWILPLPDTVLRRHIDAAFRAAGCDPPACAIESLATILIQGLLLQSDMVAVLPYQIARQFERFGLVSILPIEIDETGLPVGITLRADRELSPAAQTLAEILRHVAQEDGTEGAQRPKPRRAGAARRK